MKKIAFIVAGLLAANAYADDSQQTTLQNLNNELAALQAKVDAYAKVKNETPTVLEAHAANHLVRTDAIDPYGLMSDTGFAYSVLATKNTLTNPIILGGQLETDLQAWGGNNIIPGIYHNGTGIYLTNATLFTAANLNNYLTAVVAFGPNLGNPDNGVKNDGANSNLSVNLNRAFVNVGNLQSSPFYLTVGTNYLPFGAFNDNGPWANTITTNAFRTAATNQLTGGWSDFGFNFNAGVYQNAYFSNNNLNDYLLNVEYTKNIGKFSIAAGAGYINDIRGTNNALGNAYDGATPALVGDRTGAVDGNATVGYGDYELVGEYVTTTRGTQTNSADMDSWMTGVSYTPTIKNMPTDFGINYSASDNMQNVAMPLSGNAGAGLNTPVGNGMRSQWIFNVTPEITTNVFVGPEFDYGKLYNGQNTWAATIDGSAYF